MEERRENPTPCIYRYPYELFVLFIIGWLSLGQQLGSLGNGDSGTGDHRNGSHIGTSTSDDNGKDSGRELVAPGEEKLFGPPPATVAKSKVCVVA